MPVLKYNNGGMTIQKRQNLRATYHLIDDSISSQANSSPLKDSCQTQK